MPGSTKAGATNWGARGTRQAIDIPGCHEKDRVRRLRSRDAGRRT